MNQVDKTPIEPVWLSVDGMSCGSCVAAVERALRAVPGVRRAEVDLARARARVEGDAEPDKLTAALLRSGFEARPIKDPEEEVRHGRGCC